MSNLMSRKIVITRSLEQSKDLIQALVKERIPYIVAPVIKIIPLPLTEDLKATFHHIDHFDLILFTSSNAVRFFFYFLMNQFVPQKKYSKLKFACLGEKTNKTLESYGFKSDFIGKTTTGKQFISDVLENYRQHQNLKIFVPTSKLTNPDKYERLKINNWQLKVEAIYNTVPNHNLPASIVRQIKESQDIILTFFSPSAVKFFLNIIPANQFQPEWIVAAIGKTTQIELEKNNIPVPIVPPKSTSEELVKAIIDYFNQENNL